jgi:hypothetical protein
MYQKAGGQRRWKQLPTYKDATIRRLGHKALALLHRILIAKLNDAFNGYRGLSRKALETLNQDFEPSYGVVETEINYQLRKTKNAEIPTTAKQGKLPTPRTQPSLMSLRQEICDRVIATWDTAIYYASYMSPSFISS